MPGGAPYGAATAFPPGDAAGRDAQDPAANTLFRPSAGEPWNAPAGERP
ncbi:hypothetical protein ACFQ60_18760 [Streptomyces zhihengii]